MKGLILSALNSGAGKTMVTLGLLRALRNREVDVVSAKSGPDYIDPQFHHAASGAECVNLDAWAMSVPDLRGVAAGQSGDLLLIEGAMGLFDGAPDPDNSMGRGSVADLAAILDLPVVLVLDVSKQSQTAAAVVRGLMVQSEVRIAGVILNRVGSVRHGDMIKRAMEAAGIPVFGVIPRTKDLQTPSRHLGLVQASERNDIEPFIQKAAQIVGEGVLLDALQDIAAPVDSTNPPIGLRPLGHDIAVARDDAFAFSYPHVLNAWRRSGASVSFFSPLADEGPDPKADAVFLPGGYPELFARRLAAASEFSNGMHQAANRNAQIYGECGGYMTLGETLTDADGVVHKMLGLLPVHTSFAKPKLHLGYRHLKSINAPWPDAKGHEFHYASVTKESPTNRLYQAKDAMNNDLGALGHTSGNTFGSFIHVIA